MIRMTPRGASPSQGAGGAVRGQEAPPRTPRRSTRSRASAATSRQSSWAAARVTTGGGPTTGGGVGWPRAGAGAGAGVDAQAGTADAAAPRIIQAAPAIHFVKLIRAPQHGAGRGKAKRKADRRCISGGGGDP